MPITYTLFVMTSASAVQEIKIKSPAFANMGKIPQRYTADGQNINPPLVLDKIPDETKSLVLMVEDPNAPVDTWVHWLVWDIMPTTKLNEGILPGTEGLNSFMEHHYKGPCPPAGVRSYFFKVYALDTVLHKNCHSAKYDIMKAMKDHVIGYGELVGTYERNKIVHLAYDKTPDIYC